MSSVEQNYNIADKELLIIIAALEEWYIYIEGAIEIIIYTNYKNLLTFIITKKFNK